MFNLLRRSKNRRTYDQDNADSSSYPANTTNSNIIENKKVQKSNYTAAQRHQPHGKFTSAIDALEDFNDLDGAASKTIGEEKQTPIDEREAKFAKIYFEDDAQQKKNNQNINLATSNLAAGKKSVSLTISGAHDPSLFNRSQIMKETKQNSAIKKSTRKSLGFRKVDLDGVNSVIEAILPNDDDNEDNEDDDDDNDEHDDDNINDVGEEHSKFDQQQQTNKISERSNVKSRSLSQNERAEWSGHVLSQSPWSSSKKSKHKVCFIDQLESESNVSKLSKVFNKNCESLTKGIGNVRNSQVADQSEPATASSTGFNIAAKVGIVSNSSEVPSSNNSKQIKTARRLSYFQRKNHENPIINEQNSTLTSENDAGKVVQKSVGDEKKSQGALQKGKKLLSDIFMARGRHNSHQRNQRNQTQSQSNSNSNSNSQTTLNKSQQESSTINKSNAAVIADHNTCQNVTNNKNNSTISSDTRNSFTNVGDQHSTATMLRRHLETTNSSTNHQRDPANIHNNEMTFSNNSSKNASHRRDIFTDDNERKAQQHQRSNSAEQHRERGELERNSILKNNLSKHERAYSEEPQQNPNVERKRWSGALRDFVRVPPLKEEEEKQKTLTSNDAKKQTSPAAAAVIRARSAELNASWHSDAAIRSSNNRARSEQLQGDEREKLTECTRDRLEFSQKTCQQQQNIKINRTDANSMGQTYGKNETTNEEESRASTPREFRESQIPETVNDFLKVPSPSPSLPKITVADFSAGNNNIPQHQNNSPIEHEIFYEFENENSVKNNKNNNNVTIEDLEDSDIDDDVFHEQVSNSQPTQYTAYRHHSPLRHSPSTFLEDVPEQEENDDDDDDHDNDEEDIFTNAKSNVNGIDNEFLRRSTSRHANSVSVSPERGPLKSCDSNLSNSYPDSGISGCSESLLDTTENNNNNNVKNTTTKRTKTPSPSRSSLPSSQQQQHLLQQQQQRRQRSPFVRDSTSTDCDETLLQCDDLDCFASPSTSTVTVISGGNIGLGSSDGDERLVCIESISLPDVVESTTSSSPGIGGVGNGQNGHSTSLISTGSDDAGAGEQIININGATGNSMGNVHFIPIHVEGGERCRGGSSTRDSSPNHQQQKRRSIDDNAIGSGIKGSRLSHLNGDFNSTNKPTIEIVEEDDHSSMGFNITKISNDQNAEKLRFELQDQKTRFGAQLEDAQKNLQNLQTKITKMQTKIVNLEQELSTKTWNVERLQSELNACQLEDGFVRKKLRLLEAEKTDLRHKYDENEDEFRKKYEELELEYKELEEKYKSTQQLASNLQTQLAAAQSEAEEWHTEVDKIKTELEEQIQILKNAFENSEAERKICEDKWQKEFEMLRTQHMDREETLMTDCEWQLRQMQKQWKDKLDKSEHGRRDAVDTAEMMELELEVRKKEIEDLRHYESEVKSLRGVVTEQHNSIQALMEQIETLKTDLHTANEKLEDQVEAVKKIKLQCDNAIYDKERQMIYRIDEVRNEAAYFWENKLHTEMTRLTNELESVYVDERREALDKLQAEHVEELRALTTRYTANEEELQTELAELQERYENKSQEFLDLRQKSDNALLQTRMHLDRADREYQNAMCREEERRETLEESLRKEFEQEKEDMEVKFSERLEQLKEELMRKFQNSKQELTQKHQKELEQQRAKLRAEKDEATQELSERHRAKLQAAEGQIKDIELRHQRDLSELKATYDEDKAVLDKRDISNANEIDQLHRRCRCLTNLFEEMRMRYERRDPRQEDLREIEELRTRCDSQERDLFTLTTTLREMQMKMTDLQQNEQNQKSKKGGKSILKPPPKTIPTSCDVIYEENEERDSPPPMPLKSQENHNGQESADEVDDEDDDNDENEDDEEVNQSKSKTILNGSIASEVH